MAVIYGCWKTTTLVALAIYLPPLASQFPLSLPGFELNRRPANRYIFHLLLRSCYWYSVHARALNANTCYKCQFIAGFLYLLLMRKQIVGCLSMVPPLSWTLNNSFETCLFIYIWYCCHTLNKMVFRESEDVWKGG